MISVGPEDGSNIERIVMICGIQLACKGNEATGDVEFDLSDEDSSEEYNVKLPCCAECWEALNPGGRYSLDSQSNDVVD